MRVIVPWASACSTVAICRSGTLATVPTGSAWRSRRTSPARDRGGRRSRSRRPRRRVHRRRRRARRARARTSCATWAAVRPTQDRLVRVGRDPDLRRALARSDLRLRRSVVVGQRREDRVVRRCDRRRVVARDDDVEVVRGEARRPRRRRRRSRRSGPARARRRGAFVYAGQVDVVYEADRDPGAVGGPAARGRDDRLEARLALAGDARLDELDLGVGEQDLLGLRSARSRTASDVAPGGGDGRRPEDLLGARVDELRSAGAGRSAQVAKNRATDDADARRASSSGCAARRVMGGV